jgi:dTDP-4-dehydrorhamnose 3,5-epimerase
MIEGIELVELKIINIQEGNVYHGMKASDVGYQGFGEAYFSEVKKGAVKAWKKHSEMTMNLVVPTGEIGFVIFDDRSYSGTQGEFQTLNLSLDNYRRLTIPPGLWFGFKGLGDRTNLLLNLANIEHDPAEGDKKGIEEIAFDWSKLI